ncbi:cub and sushi domain-containing protein 3 isoform [Lynx pardinus]|uniref:Cub and sushi domain-containing protein 3 isoform n=1 Tax=Lynx pardinus TaxID=191816 RepID=A0A485PL61_LYNPA|nr:cub and sushi domain-containing protein 3 isoform [Lynx pardinus]
MAPIMDVRKYAQKGLDTVIQITFEEFDLKIGYDTLIMSDGGEVGDPRTVFQM